MSTSEPIVESEVVAQARARVRTRYGADLADKATVEFCLAHALTTEGVYGLEALGVHAGTQNISSPTVVEFAPSTEAGPTSETLRFIRDSASKALADAIAGTEGASDAEQHVGTAARHLMITAFRDEFLRTAGRVHDDLERTASGLTRSRQGTQTREPPFTRICWLNRSIRVEADPRAVADVAADPAVARIDLPRRLEADLVVTASTVGAIQFRTASGKGGAGIIVAVIDSEAALQHPALDGRVVHRRNFTDESFGIPDAHGTAVAGIIGSAGDPEGMAPEAMLYNYKVLASNRFLNGDDFDGALAIQQALEDGAHIANCSWGAGPAGDGAGREARACDAAWALGLTIVKSAGNRGPDPRTLTTPADADGVIVVGATDRRGTSIADYSSRGPTAGGQQRPHLVAPGGGRDDEVVSSLVHGGFGNCGFGTSYAAPHVAGLAALLLAREPTLDPDAIRDMLIDACTPLDNASADEQGAGAVNLAATSD